MMGVIFGKTELIYDAIGERGAELGYLLLIPAEPSLVPSFFFITMKTELNDL